MSDIYDLHDEALEDARKLRAENTRLAARIETLEARVELLEGYLRGALDVAERLVACDTKDARAALTPKP